jgi:hypothetical protein
VFLRSVASNLRRAPVSPSYADLSEKRHEIRHSFGELSSESACRAAVAPG